MARLLEEYRNKIVPDMVKKFEIANKMAVPKLKKICLNMGVGKALENSRILEDALRDLTTIAGQKAVVTKAKISVSNFKLRAGNRIGCRVTLRGERMFEFLDRLINVGIPRIKDFRGLSNKSFDGRGNYSIGVTEQILFPEVDPDKIEHILGMDVTFVISGSSDEQSHELLKLFGMPFREK